MQTHINCIPCYFKQTIEAARMAGANDQKIKKIVDEVGYNLRNFDIEATQPEVAMFIHKIIRSETGNMDPYKSLKNKSNFWAMSLEPLLEERVEKAPDKLLAAIRIAIAGNMIDYGSNTNLMIQERIEDFLNSTDDEINSELPQLFRYSDFKTELDKAKKVLYIGDNAGEIVFDKILVNELNKRGKEVIFATREAPIINDCLLEDAKKVEMDKIATVISSGSSAPGTILHECSGHFINLFEEADMIISKGQGNFESLEGTSKNVFFLFIVKCPVMASRLESRLNQMIMI